MHNYESVYYTIKVIWSCCNIIKYWKVQRIWIYVHNTVTDLFHMYNVCILYILLYFLIVFHRHFPKLTGEKIQQQLKSHNYKLNMCNLTW